MSSIQHLNPDGTPKYTNRLLAETSPYLRQHAHNPVDWYAWSDEAFARAKEQRKPIHLSVGYRACHWCHVLADESFEDEDTARVLNEHFVNIKVDREERPDVDRIYQIAQQVLTQRSGGWPLTMFLTHDDKRPFFGGTYFPKEARYGLPAFKDLLLRVADYYRSHEPELRKQNEALMSVFADLNPPPAPADTALNASPLDAARAALGESFDPRYGGFGGAPKFPHPLTLAWLLRRWQARQGTAQPDDEALAMATLTLRRMAEGGLNDQLAGGFCRYSVDELWMIPHFEKMLYDNGALLAVYAEAALATGDPLFAGVAARTADWLLREMRSPEGGFYSSLDADSDGHEGKFYVWDREEVRQRLTEPEYAVFSRRFGLDRPPNFEGRWHLHACKSLDEVARDRGVSAAAVSELLESARHKLLQVREHRLRPARDEKILTSWNALAIRALAIAARALERDDLAVAASQALDFIRARLFRAGRLLATCTGERAHLHAYLDDYVYLADAVLELQQVRFRPVELAFARQLLEVVLERFSDPVNGGFFFTADDHESLIHRAKSFADDATPAGNGVAAAVLTRIGYLLAEPRLLAAAEGTLRSGWLALQRQPLAHMSLLTALEELRTPPEIVVLRGTNAEIERWHRELLRQYAPRRLVLAVPADCAELAPAVAAKVPRGTATAYICRGSLCSAPLDTLADLLAALR